MAEVAYLADFDRPSVMRALVEQALNDPAVYLTRSYLVCLYTRWLMSEHGLWEGPLPQKSVVAHSRSYKPWTEADDRFLLNAPDRRTAAEQLDRSLSAVQARRCMLRRTGALD